MRKLMIGSLLLGVSLVIVFRVLVPLIRFLHASMALPPLPDD